MRYVKVENGTVVNAIEAGEEFARDRGFIRSDIAGPGWVYDGGNFSPPPEPFDFNVDVLAKTEEIRDAAEAVLAPFRAEYGAVEMATWDQQTAEARAYLADPLPNAANYPLIYAIATGRGQDVTSLANRIVTNETNWKRLSGLVVGQRLGWQDQVNAIAQGVIEGTLTTAQGVEAVRAIVPYFQLPGA